MRTVKTDLLIIRGFKNAKYLGTDSEGNIVEREGNGITASKNLYIVSTNDKGELIKTKLPKNANILSTDGDGKIISKGTIKREISFVANNPIKIQHSTREKINAIKCTSIETIEYSENVGETWLTVNEAIEVEANTETLWRVSSYKNGIIGNVILKSNIIQ